MDDLQSGRCLEDGRGFDWLSTLCDDLLLEIFGFMSLKQAGQTHGLSRRWRHLWSFYRDLVFRVDDGGTLDDGIASAEALDNVIAHYKGPKIGYLHLNIRSYKATDAQIDSWIRCAIERDVESIWFALWEPQEPYQMTHELFCSRFLTSLFLHNCALDLPDLVGLNSLKDVGLRKVYFSRRFLRRFTSGCPVLQKVYLDECNMKSNLFVCIINPSVQNLRIGDGYGNHGIGSDGTIKLYAPSILYLKVEGIVRRSYTIDNVSSLVEAKVDVRIYSKEDVLLWKNLLGSLSCEKLELCSWCLQILALSRLTNEPFSMLPVTCLDLKLSLLKCEILGLFYLIRISPQVESLTINFGFWDKGMNEEAYMWASTIKKRLSDYIILNFWKIGQNEDELDGENNGEGDSWALVDATGFFGNLRRLKRIELKNFHGLGFLGAINCEIPKEVFEAICRRQVQLVKQLLKHSPHLEELNIHFPEYLIPPFPNCFTYESEELVIEMRNSVTQGIQLFPRASPKAKLCFF